jgi:hypothetical protein
MFNQYVQTVEYTLLSSGKNRARTFMIKKCITSSMLALGLAFAQSSSAVVMFTFDVVGETLQTFYSFTQDGATITTEVDYKLTAITAGQADFDVTVINTTPATEPGTNRIVSFGVDIVTPTLTGASTTNSFPTLGEWDAVIGPTTFPGFQKVDLCSFAGPDCSGGSSLGVAEGLTDTFHLILAGAFNSTTPNSVMFTSPFPAKFQAVGNSGNSFEVDACETPTNCVGTPVPVPDVGLPEPGTLALLALGVLGIYASRRRTTSR